MSARPGQLRVALTGGVGAGKSALADELAALGAVRIDADQVAREVVSAGTPGLAEVLDRFGPSVCAADGELDRPALAALVFADPGARADLNAIVHPLVQQRSSELMDAAPGDAVIVYEVPLLAETGQAAEFDRVVVVEAPVELRLGRLAGRGVGEDDARARISAQATDDQRRALADVVVRNDGDRRVLAERAAQLWADLICQGDEVV